MMQTNNSYINIGDGELYYEVAGEGKPLVLSHAGFVDSRMWDDQWSDFAQQQRVIRFDMRGFGKSALGITPIERRRDLDRFLRQLDVPRATLLGCSLSGEVMLDFALEHPEKVTALILVSTAPGGFEMQGPPPAPLRSLPRYSTYAITTLLKVSAESRRKVNDEVIIFHRELGCSAIFHHFVVIWQSICVKICLTCKYSP